MSVALVDPKEDIHPEARSIHEKLVQRGFARDVQIICVDDTHPSSRIIRGLYYQRPRLHNGRSHYQQVKIIASPYDPKQTSFVCSSLYVHWDNRCWMIGPLLPGKTCFASCAAEDSEPYLATPWLFSTGTAKDSNLDNTSFAKTEKIKDNQAGQAKAKQVRNKQREAGADQTKENKDMITNIGDEVSAVQELGARFRSWCRTSGQ